MLASARRHALFAAVFAVAALLRVVDLDRVPNPAGDEGTWTWMAFRLAHGTPAGLDADANFVSLTHARLMSYSMRAFGEGFFSARLVGVVAVLLAVSFMYAALVRIAAPRAGLVASAVIAFHPWSILWARTASVPYALALLVLTVAPTLFVIGLRARRPAVSALGILAFSLGPDFSPLTVLPAIACVLFVLQREHRWLLRRAIVWLAIVAAAAHALPIVAAASRVARHTAPRAHLDHLATRVATYLHLTLTGLAGEATLRHFTTTALSPGFAAPLALVVLAVVLLAAHPDVRRHSPLGGFGPLAFAVTLIGMPLLLAPGRPWHLARIDTDRYLFALLPSFAMCCGDLAHDERRVTRHAVVAIALALITLASARGAVWFARGGGPDLGLEVFRGGGGYRGWHVAREREPVPLLLRDTVLHEVGPGGAMMVIADMAFHPLHVANAVVGLPVFDARLGPIPRRADGRYFFVLWSDAMFPAGSAPTGPSAENHALRQRMNSEFIRVRLVRRVIQPNGFPLCELWRGERE